MSLFSQRLTRHLRDICRDTCHGLCRKSCHGTGRDNVAALTAALNFRDAYRHTCPDGFSRVLRRKKPRVLSSVVPRNLQPELPRAWPRILPCVGFAADIATELVATSPAEMRAPPWHDPQQLVSGTPCRLFPRNVAICRSYCRDAFRGHNHEKVNECEALNFG